MFINIEVNNKTLKAKKGENILEALRRNGIDIPTLCNMQGFSPTGACRICVVEVEGKDNLLPACSHPIEEWMNIKTHSPRVIKARKTIVELLLANHPDDCLYCEKNGKCELQKIAEELNIRERSFPGKKSRYRLDQSSSSIIRDPSKCILCGRCVRICEEKQGVSAIDFTNRGHQTIIETAFAKGLNVSSCVTCGQCIMVCPTGALHEKDHFDEVVQALNDQEMRVVVQYAPAISVSLSETFDLRAGKNIYGILNAALRKIGFEKIFDTSFGADLATMENVAELNQRLENEENLPLLTSCCPGWIKYVEQFMPEMIPYLSSAKSPQQMLGAIIKSHFAKQEGIPPEKIFSVAIMPCTAKKFESQRVEMIQKGIPDVDVVLTTRELIRLIRLSGIDMNNIEEEVTDPPLGTRSSAGKLFGVSGGVTESAIRTFYQQKTGKDLQNFKFPDIRGQKEFKETSIEISGRVFKFAIVYGLKQAFKLIQQVKSGKVNYDFIEIMACPGGCIGGGGQPYNTDKQRIKTRMKSVYQIDDKAMIRAAYKNPAIMELYDHFLKEPLGEKSRKLLHTNYSQRNVLI